MRSLGSAPMAESLSAYFATCPEFFLICASVIFL